MAFLERGLGETILWPSKNGFPQRFLRYLLLHAAVGVEGAVVILGAGLRACLRAHIGAGLAALLLIELAEDGVHLLGEGVHGVLDFARVVALADLLEIVDLGLDGVLVFVRELVAVVLELLFHFVDEGIGLVEGFDFFLLLLVGLGELLTRCWISSSVMLVEAVMVTFCSLPVPKSLADTFTMPLRSMLKVTSIWGTPRGAEGMPVSWKRPRVLLS